NALAARNDDEVRNVDAMIMQNFFRDAFVFAKNESSRAATGEGDALHVEKRNNVLVEPAVVFELVGEVKNYIRPEGFQFLPQQVKIIKDGEMLFGIAKGVESAQDVCFGFPVLGFHLLAQVLIDGGRPDGVEKREDFEF